MVKLNSKGFTLVEILVVITIIAMLSAIVVINVSQVMTKHLITRVETDLTMLQAAANQYYYEMNRNDLIKDDRISQGKLVAEGCLPQMLASPVANYDYMIVIQSKAPVIIVKLINAQGEVYTNGRFLAQIPSPLRGE